MMDHDGLAMPRPRPLQGSVPDSYSVRYKIRGMDRPVIRGLIKPTQDDQRESWRGVPGMTWIRTSEIRDLRTLAFYLKS